MVVINSNVLVYNGSRMIDCEKKLIKNFKIFLNKILFKNVDMSNDKIMKTYKSLSPEILRFL